MQKVTVAQRSTLHHSHFCIGSWMLIRKILYPLYWILKFTRRCLVNWVDHTTMGYHLSSAHTKDGASIFPTIFFNWKMSCISQPPDFPVSDWKIERDALWWTSESSALAWSTDFLDSGIVFSTFSADLVEKIGRHKFQQPYFGNHVLGCL